MQQLLTDASVDRSAVGKFVLNGERVCDVWCHPVEAVLLWFLPLCMLASA